MTREELLKMSKKDLKNRLAELGKNAQALSGQELTDAMDEARTIGEILDEIKGREELVAAAKAAGAADPDEGDGAGEGSEEPQDQERAKRGKTLKDGKKAFFKGKALAGIKNTLTTATGVVMPKHTSPDISPTFNNVSSLIDRVNLKTDLVKPIGEELKPVISDVIKEVKGKIPEVKTLVLAVVSKVKDFISFMSRNGTQIISIIAGIAAGMLAWNVVTMIQGLVAAIKVWKATTEGVTIAQKILNTVMAANPIGIVITVVAALVAALVTLFATNEDFRNKVIAVWEAVKEAASKVFGAIADFFTVTIPNAFNGFINFIKSNWQALLLLIVNPFAGAFKLLYDNCGAFREFVDNFVQNIKQFFQNLWNGIVSIFQGVGQWFIDRFTEAYNGVTGVFAAIGQWFGARWQDIKNALATVASWFLTMFTNAYTNVKNVFSAIGSWFGARWTEIKTALSAVPSWFGTQFQNAWTNIKNAFANVTSFFSGLWEKIKGCFVNVGVKIGSAVGDAFKSAINSCLSTIEGVVNKFIGMINGVIDVINEIPGVSLGKIGTLSLPRLAKGGVLKEGTAMVAEAGPELLSMVNGKAVVTPLSGSAKNQAMENAGKGGGGYVQNVNITSPKALSPYEIARQTRLQTRSMILAVQRG